MNGILKKQNPILNFLLQHRYSAFFLLVGVFSVGIGIFLVRDINTAMGEALIKVGSMLALTLLMAAGVLNVTERGKRLRVIQLSEERLNAVIESINDGMFVVAHDGQVEMVNQAAEKRWSQPRDAMLGRQLSDIMPDLKGTPIPEAIKECVRTEKL